MDPETIKIVLTAIAAAASVAGLFVLHWRKVDHEKRSRRADVYLEWVAALARARLRPEDPEHLYALRIATAQAVAIAPQGVGYRIIDALKAVATRGKGAGYDADKAISWINTDLRCEASGRFELRRRDDLPECMIAVIFADRPGP